MRICIFCFAAYIVVSLVSLQVEISSKRKELTQVQQLVEEQRLANKETERLLNLGDDRAYLSRIARDKLDMGNSDERVFRDASGS
ncbi:FtsB family cell division protein [Youxingia wuxianensis]|uniref:Septum formation initiator family protein n=1 Tax=Youxingia wuxianensis TaxID=2763678 RepID=A0A926ELX4_9FIRM|nr:septum formation initiator family protein [Youxingia wuxianensis]MBC8585011.1 septum formation initiator family protein [Youxingia wuxianensis]